ncbi:unnamed protein product [Protopolystoma xenopodis]|uniref:Uncharacterized protein n=1 Tax=Protopolystoma xenopodis TaxID=117903 RepID=A0A3S5AYZ1_9PLAT|nr:unnamed protein product [Protopolystoma xenopodis]
MPSTFATQIESPSGQGRNGWKEAYSDKVACQASSIRPTDLYFFVEASVGIEECHHQYHQHRRIQPIECDDVVNSHSHDPYARGIYFC